MDANNIEALAKQYKLESLLNANGRVAVAHAKLTAETRCPICFGILKNPRVSSVCLHRYCASCIDTCLAGRPPEHKECPVCRANLHSRRSTHLDTVFDRVIRALYGDVAVYEAQEEALIAASNRQHVAEAAAQDALRKAQRAAQEAAAAAARHGGRGNGQNGSCSNQNGAGARGTTSAVRHSSSGAARTSGSAAAGAAGSKRSARDESPPDGEGMALDGSGGLNSPGKRFCRRSGSLPAAMLARCQSAASGNCEDLIMRAIGEVGAAADAAQATAERLPRHGSSNGAGLPVAASSRHGSIDPRSPTAAAALAVAAAGAAGSQAGGLPHLSAPCARTALELSGRLPGTVLVQLKPADAEESPLAAADPGQGSGSLGSPGRWLRARNGRGGVLPPLERPFFLCPAKWTVAHVCQLAAQQLKPQRTPGGRAAGAGPGSPHGAQRGPGGVSGGGGSSGNGAASIELVLEPAPGLLRGHHGRQLRGCVALGSLQAEARDSEYGHLVLLYSVHPRQ